MQNRYLEILELRPGASKSEIRSAYRRLSKRYHPDVNKGEEAHEKFLEIHEAYKFLTEVGPRPNDQQTAYDYDPYAEEYSRWRERARAYAWQKMQEARQQKSELIQKILGKFKYVAGVIILFNSLLSIDYLLPRKEHLQRILGIDQIFDIRSRYYKYDEIHFENFTMRFEAGEIILSNQYEQGIVQATPIFDKPMAVQITTEGSTHIYHQVYNIYRVFGVIIPGIFLLFLLYLILHTPDHKLTLAIFMIFLFLTQLFLFFRF